MKRTGVTDLVDQKRVPKDDGNNRVLSGYIYVKREDESRG